MESKLILLTQMRVPMYLAVNATSADGTLITEVVIPQRGKSAPVAEQALF